MTTAYNHAGALWQPSIAGKSSLLRQYGAPRGISHPAAIGFIESGGNIYDGSPFGTGGPVTIFPYVFHWPSALVPTDSAGVAFPAGMLAVVLRAWLPCHPIGPPSPPFGPPVAIDYTGTVNDGLEFYWTSAAAPSGEVWTLANPTAVPGTLPLGYTVNRQTAFASRSPLLYSDAYAIPAGFVRPAWQAGIGCGLFGSDASKTAATSGVVRTGPDGGGNFKWWMVVHAGVGLRKFQYRMVSAGGAWTVRVSHNADGHAFDPGSPTEGDTADFTSSGGSGTSGWIDAGALTPTLGTVTSYQVSIESASSWSSIGLRSSCRTDVPLPYTVTGIGDLIAPGGYVP